MREPKKQKWAGITVWVGLVICPLLWSQEQPQESAEKEKTPEHIDIQTGIAKSLKEIRDKLDPQNNYLVRLTEDILLRDENPGLENLTVFKTQWFDEKKWAPKLPIERKVLKTGSQLWKSAVERFTGKKPHPKNYPSLEPTLLYSFTDNKIYKTEHFQNQLNAFTLLYEFKEKGHHPDQELAYNVVLKSLDHDESKRKLSWYFDHSYTDRQGNVYPEITLYDVWNSGRELEMPDVDTVPYAWEFMKDKSIQSPIPAGKKRNRLYQNIAMAFKDYRRYRETVVGIAKCFFESDPKISPLVKPLIDRFHFLIIWTREDPYLIGNFIMEHPTRNEFIDEVDKLMKDLGDRAWKAVKDRKEFLMNSRAQIKKIAKEVIDG